MKPIRVYVHLVYGQDAAEWEKRFKAGIVPDRVPYGYHHAICYNCQLTYSHDHRENKFINFFRRALTRIIGFDLIHAWRNRGNLEEVDIVWTHTEREHLAIACLFLVMQLSKRPKLLAQSVWLFDRWKSFCILRRWFYKFLLKQASILTVHSPENSTIAKSIIPIIPVV